MVPRYLIDDRMDATTNVRGFVLHVFNFPNPMKTATPTTGIGSGCSVAAHWWCQTVQWQSADRQTQHSDHKSVISSLVSLVNVMRVFENRSPWRRCCSSTCMASLKDRFGTAYFWDHYGSRISKSRIGSFLHTRLDPLNYRFFFKIPLLGMLKPKF